ncbi:MAG TPA: MBL fold metallo-hydrolase [Bacteroidia bacterium]|nr:MBL fold metallo-hydrolase [Bacteroidia bacterium]HRG53253.1 MBL fold metallo-hydrolase [Bacteroidia bacterium]
MKLHSIHTGNFKLDGGAMFGVVPKKLWSKTNPADENNLCNWAMRCLLIEDGKRLILVDNGLGDKQDEKFFSHYALNGEDTLEKSLKKAGFSVDDITDMFLTHLHFDHCGGSIRRNKEKTGYETVFKNATYWSNVEHWEWATKPNAREKASFLTENILPIQESGQLKFVKDENDKPFGDSISISYMRGHTDAMMIPLIRYKEHTIAFMADLLPSVGHIPLPYVMGYDTRPLLTLTEKEKFLKRAADEKLILFLEHDSVNECCTVENTDKGVRLKQTLKFEEL